LGGADGLKHSNPLTLGSPGLAPGIADHRKAVDANEVGQSGSCRSSRKSNRKKINCKPSEAPKHEANLSHRQDTEGADDQRIHVPDKELKSLASPVPTSILCLLLQ
jgi:hypothetical protein